MEPTFSAAMMMARDRQRLDAARRARRARLSRMMFDFSLAKGFEHRRRAPSKLPLPGSSLQRRIKRWEKVLAWLHDLKDAIEDSLNKDLDDLSALSRADHDDRSASYHLVPLEWVEMPSGPQPPVIDGDTVEGSIHELIPPSIPYMNLTPWGRWNQQQLDLRTCNLKKIFYGQPDIPHIIDTPSSTDMIEISCFVKVHESYLFKHWEHLEYLLDLISASLIPQVESNMEDLQDELKLREQAALLPKRNELLSGVPSNQAENVDYLFPESEDDYPDEQEDEVFEGVETQLQATFLYSGEESTTTDPDEQEDEVFEGVETQLQATFLFPGDESTTTDPDEQEDEVFEGVETQLQATFLFSGDESTTTGSDSPTPTGDAS